MNKPEQGGLKNDQSFRRVGKFSLTGAADKVLEAHYNKAHYNDTKPEN